LFRAFVYGVILDVDKFHASHDVAHSSRPVQFDFDVVLYSLGALACWFFVFLGVLVIVKYLRRPR
jgi:hypothetical protein